MKILAYIQNSHWQDICKEKYFDVWVSKTEARLNATLPEGLTATLTVVEESDLTWDKEAERVLNIILEQQPNIILNLPKLFIDRIGIPYFAQNNIVVFSPAEFKDELIAGTNVFSTNTKRFSPAEALLWFAEQHGSKKIIFLEQEGDKPSDSLNELKSKAASLPVEVVKIQPSIVDELNEKFEVIWDSERFVTRVDNITQNDLKKLHALFKKANLEVDQDTLFAHHFPHINYFFIGSSLRHTFGSISVFDLGRSAWVPEKTVKYFHTYQTFPRFRVLKELNSYFGDLTDFQGFDLDSLYRDVYDIIFCIALVINDNQIKHSDAATFSSSLAGHLRSMKEKFNYYIGHRDDYCFDGNFRSIKDSHFYRCAENIEANKNVSLYYKKQPDEIDPNQTLDTWYIFVDILSVKNVDISSGLWFFEFELQINSTISKPIEHINFLNNSAANSLWETKVISEHDIDGRFQSKYRINASFDFLPETKDFPFDTQTLAIDFCLETSAPDAILQPTPQGFVDKDFVIDGWTITSCLAGKQNEIAFQKVGPEAESRPFITSHIKNEWVIKRDTRVASIKSFVPLYILIFLCWYGSFLNFEDSTTVVELNTTVFLAGVALYFTADRPNTSNLTIIDKFFMVFYSAVGLLILSEFSSFFGEKIYDTVHLIWQIAIPILVGLSGWVLFKKSTR